MSNESPAAILFDELGNPVGVMFDGYAYRLQVEAKLASNVDNFLSSDRSIFGSGVIADRLSQVSASFVGQLTDTFNNNIGQITSGSGSINISNSVLQVSSGTDNTSTVQVFTNSTTKYYPGREIYVQFTAGFTIPTDVNSEQQAGLYDGYNGFFIGYHGTIFGLTIRNLSMDSFVPLSSCNGDLLDGNINSKFTRDNVPEVLNFTFSNVYRIRFGWLGSAPILFQIMAPDGQWVTFHTIRQPNTSSMPGIADPNLPITFEIIKNSSDTNNIQITTSSWDAGIVDSSQSPFRIVPTFSLLNSTSELLDGYASFIGISEDVSTYVSIDITVLSDQISDVNGLLLEWSQDGIIFAYPEKFTILPGLGAFYSFAPRAKYFRLTYTNGPVNQTQFSLTTVYYPVNRSIYVQNLNTDIAAQRATDVVRSVLAAQKTGGINSDYTNLQATDDGILKVISEITDSVNGPVAVKSPFTAAIASDPALVVAISPNNSFTVTTTKPATSVTSSVSGSTSNSNFLPSNGTRLGATIYNDSSALLYIKLGAVASVTDYTIKLFPLSYYEVPYGYTGQIDGIWSNATGFVRISELTS